MKQEQDAMQVFIPLFFHYPTHHPVPNHFRTNACKNVMKGNLVVLKNHFQLALETCTKWKEEIKDDLELENRLPVIDCIT